MPRSDMLVKKTSTPNNRLSTPLKKVLDSQAVEELEEGVLYTPDNCEDF